jgi:transcriptional regulator with XRE-family HTH domain
MIVIDNLSRSFLVNFGETVKEKRLSKNLTQKQLAKNVGVSHEWICKIEKAKAKTISLTLIYKVKDYLEIKDIKI